MLGVDRTHLLINSETQVARSHYNSYLRLVERRAHGEPLQYITGHQEFYGLDFIVNPSVLIPRPETELVVDRVIDLAQQFNEESLLVADIGTGSGCIAVAVAVHVKSATVIAADLSQAAIDLARANAERHRVADRIQFFNGDLFKPFAERGLREAISIFASNPPYVDREEPDLIQRQVHDWEPHAALFGGEGGSSFHRRLLHEGFEYAKTGGYLVFEIGYGQIDSITRMIAESPWTLIDLKSDLQGIPRTVTVRKPLEQAGPVRV